METQDDFVGTHTVGGFALHDDEDDVYDRTVVGDGGDGSHLGRAACLDIVAVDDAGNGACSLLFVDEL